MIEDCEIKQTAHIFNSPGFIVPNSFIYDTKYS